MVKRLTRHDAVHLVKDKDYRKMSKHYNDNLDEFVGNFLTGNEIKQKVMDTLLAFGIKVTDKQLRPQVAHYYHRYFRDGVV